MNKINFKVYIFILFNNFKYLPIPPIITNCADTIMLKKKNFYKYYLFYI